MPSLKLIGGLVVMVLVLALLAVTKLYLDKRDELAATRVELRAAQDSNTSNLTTIGDLRAANAEWVSACGADPATAARTIEQLQRGETAARGEAAALRRELRRMSHADPTVDAYLRTGVPGAVADGLRDAPPGGPH